MTNYLNKYLIGKKVLILGFGKEGRSTARMLSSINVDCEITIADRNESAFTGLPDTVRNKSTLIYGEDYLSGLKNYDIIIKSPGVRLDMPKNFSGPVITSQTDLFLKVYGKQTIGITGTKGKSTTSSLIYHIIRMHNENTVFGGNIGTPLFDLTEKINEHTTIVCELSSHQLQYTHYAPHIGILLNLYQEHLDHYNSFRDYQLAKYNIALNQSVDDYFIYNASDKNITNLLKESPPVSKLIPFNDDSVIKEGIKETAGSIYLNDNKILPSDFQFKPAGIHNRKNAAVAAAVAFLKGVPQAVIEKAISSFIPLEHRLEFVGNISGVRYYNDSISTIPEATIAAIESLKPVNTVILGGYDRGIDYEPLITYLRRGHVKNMITTGPAGLHIFELASSLTEIEELFYISRFDEAVYKAIEVTPQGGSVLLSPAASSYNEFSNFEERGNRFKELISKSEKK